MNLTPEQLEIQRKMIVTNKEIIEAGLVNEFTPPIEYCEYCGAERLTRGITFPLKDDRGNEAPGGILWRGEYKGMNNRIRYAPDECSCPEAKEASRAQQEEDKAQQDLRKANEHARRIDEWRERLYIQSELGANFRAEMTLDGFQTPPTPADISQMSSSHKAKNQCVSYVNLFDSDIRNPQKPLYGKGMYFSGPSGTGKTHLAVGTLRKLTERGIATLGIQAPKLFNRLREGYNDHTGEKFGEVMHLFINTEVLLIDDLGTEKPTDWTLEKLYSILDERMNHHRPTFITTNFPDNELIERLIPKESGNARMAEAIVSRLRGMTVPIRISGRDFRITPPRQS